MATTTATITLASTDLLSDELALTTTANLTTAGTSTGITQAAGLSRNTTTSTGAVTLFAASSYGDNKAAKIYLKITNSEAARYIIITHGSTNIGRLYAGDWALLPWDGAGDFKYTPGQSDSTTVEFMMFHEGA
tara:strand:+ start:173 stop:571 length:399 start_codon:yes stop_codon:yes gene_type:complete